MGEAAAQGMSWARSTLLCSAMCPLPSCPLADTCSSAALRPRRSVSGWRFGWPWRGGSGAPLPTAAAGITTGVMLAVARAAGETAPLILTALGAYKVVTALVGEPISALPLALLSGARNPFEAGQARAWAGALQLLVMVLVLTLAARIISSRSKIQR